MTHEDGRVRRVHAHLPISPDAQNNIRTFLRLLAGHPGVFSAAAREDGQRLMIDYDPALTSLADLASIVRVGGHQVTPSDRQRSLDRDGADRSGHLTNFSARPQRHFRNAR